MSRQFKVLAINSVTSGSTGTIMLQISKIGVKNGYNTSISCPKFRNNNHKKNDNVLYIGNRIERKIHLKLAYHTGMNGCYSKYGTKKFLEKVNLIEPDIIHLHNLHNCYINLGMLFNFIKEKKIPVVWTLHDCWPFTGKCPHYTIANCNKWKTGCYDCPLYNEYPATKIDKTKELYILKKEWFTGVERLTIVTPSNWLKNQVKQSFLKEYPVKVINNGINLSIFKPTQSNFREKYGLEKKKILLGVASPWTENKGLAIFKELESLLDDDYKIVLVGLNSEQTSEMSENILSLPKTSDAQELAKIYTAADLFINPSIEETMGLVTIEALACGTPVIVSNSTALPEFVCEGCGIIVNNYSARGFLEGIKEIQYKNINNEVLFDYSSEFQSSEKYKLYIDLYNEILQGESQA